MKKFFSTIFFLLAYSLGAEVEQSKISMGTVIEEYLKKEEYKVSTPLCSLMSSLGSDKGEGWHNYTTLYSKIFNHLKNSHINFFELGIGTNDINLPSNMGINGKPGASLYGWSEYFPQANIFGADIDKNILFSTKNIKTFYCDQRDKNSINEMYENAQLKNILFDVIIDDGLHEFDANFSFLFNSMAKLKDGGIYIVEDLNEDSKQKFLKELPNLKQQLNLSYVNVVTIPYKNHYDNTLIIIQK